jgi:hypothetical protein
MDVPGQLVGSLASGVRLRHCSVLPRLLITSAEKPQKRGEEGGVRPLYTGGSPTYL